MSYQKSIAIKGGIFNEGVLPVYFLFLLSGFPALLYQITWQRALFTLLGTNIESITIVVAAFMLGLGIGGVAGGYLSKIKGVSPLIMFSLIEITIGIFGIFSFDLFQSVGEVLVHMPYTGLLIGSFLMVCIPTIFMGATLPILVHYMVHIYPNVGRSVGSLYFVNTLGSAIAAFWAGTFLMGMFGLRGVVYIAVAINTLISAGVLCYAVYGEKSTEGESETYTSHKSVPAIVSEQRGSITSPSKHFSWILFLAFMSGAIVLSYEIMWMRVFAYISGGGAAIFPIILSLFLAGLAVGSFVSGKICAVYKNHLDKVTRFLSVAFLCGAVLGYMLLPLIALGETASFDMHWGLVLITSFLLGIPFPLISHLGIVANVETGKKIGYVYIANVIGATVGILFVGLIVIDMFPIQYVAMGVSLAGALVALSVWVASFGLSKKIVAIFVVIAVMMVGASPALSASLFDKLQYKRNYTGQSLKHVVENKSGVISVNSDDWIFGEGVYDGKFNIDPIHDTNGIVRPYVLSAFHPNPERVLMIGLSSGSWAQVIASHPSVKEFVIVEINPGYLQLIKQYDIVASLLVNKKVSIIIDDGRRWLMRHPNETFDAIIMNTTYHWRAYVSNLLSRDFLRILSRHLREGGIVYYTTTSSLRAQKTASVVFPSVYRFMNFIVASNKTIVVDTDRLRSVLKKYTIDGKHVFDISDASQAQRIEDIVAMFDANRYGEESSVNTLSYPIETRNSILQRSRNVDIITDDNMGDEWIYGGGL